MRRATARPVLRMCAWVTAGRQCIHPTAPSLDACTHLARSCMLHARKRRLMNHMHNPHIPLACLLLTLMLLGGPGGRAGGGAAGTDSPLRRSDKLSILDQMQVMR